MRIAAYCRVSTDKEDQLHSLRTQKEFFVEYAKQNNHELTALYADEGISGTKLKRRKRFLDLMKDAERNLFDMVVVKDIARFARNTVDLLQSVRTLKSLGIDTLFVTANMTTLGNSEFVLTMYGALAQEESANMSKRVKFTKQINAEKGRVPNIVYGYDKVKGDYFNLPINESEAKVVRQMFSMYVNDGYGTTKIAKELNRRGIKTKRGNDWSQTTVAIILKNPIYIGQVINGREEITDFLTGERTKKDESEWSVVENPDLKIIEPDIFEKAQRLLAGRHDVFKHGGSRQSNKHLFSTLIKCKECGWSYRRTRRTYQNTYIRWTCSYRNKNGEYSCPNKTTVDEGDLKDALREYFTGLLSAREGIVDSIVKRITKLYHDRQGEIDEYAELKTQHARIVKTRQKYMDMFTDDLITREELNERIGGMKSELELLSARLREYEVEAPTEVQIEYVIKSLFRKIEDIVDIDLLTNAQLKEIIDRIEVGENRNIEVYLKGFKDVNLPSDTL